MKPQNLSLNIDFIATDTAPDITFGIDPQISQQLSLDNPEQVGLILRGEDKVAAGIISKEELNYSLETGTTLEVIYEKNNLLPAWFLEVGAKYAKPVCKIETSGSDYQGRQGSWVGTGFLVSENILLTNHHVLNSPESAQNATCIFNYQKDENGQEVAVENYRLNPERLFITSPVEELDFTFVWVDGSPGKTLGFVPIDRTSFKIVAGENANIIQHPSGDFKSLALQDNEVYSQDRNVVHYSSDTMPGSSGSCVFNNEWKLIALHHASHQDPDTKKILNEGIKTSAIAIYLEQLIQDPQKRLQAIELLKLFIGTSTLIGFFGSIGREVPTNLPGPEIVVNSYKGEADDIDIGFWNIEWFNRRYADKLDEVSQIIVQMNLDIWAFAESSPQATKKLVDHLKRKYRLDFKWAASEPNASGEKQTTTVIWNGKTVRGERRDWPDEIEDWLKVDSRQFDRLGLEAVEGKVFDRYPGLFYFTALDGRRSNPFNFYLVPLHLKAMAEGSKRRRMAAKILGAAVQKMMLEYNADEDWVLGGDYNAEMLTQDFNDLSNKDFVPIGAKDEDAGAFSYLKRPKSLIDHIFLSANLARTQDEDNYFIVAQEKTIPDYIERISDHRPVLVRLSLQKPTGPESQTGGGESQLILPWDVYYQPSQAGNGRPIPSEQLLTRDRP